MYDNGKPEKSIADLLVSGQNVEVNSAFDDRLIQKFRIAGQKVLPDIVVIGSSRTMQIGSNVFPDKYVINNAVPNCSLGDFLGIIFNYDKKKEFPRTMVLGVDPWLFNSSDGKYMWETYKDDTFGMLKKLKIPLWIFRAPLIPAPIANIFSLSYFQWSVIVFRQNKPQDHLFFPTSQEIDQDDVLLRDGRRSYNIPCRTMSVEDVEKKANSVINTQVQDFSFREPDRGWEDIWEKLISYLQSEHVNVVFFLAPYHPIVYNSFLVSEQNKRIVEFENYYRDFAKRHKLKILGSYDPSKVGLSENDFYDGEHASKEAVEKIFRQGW